MSEWIHARADLIPFNTPVEVVVDNSVRQAIRAGINSFGLTFTDCKNPMQNVNCSFDGISAFRVLEAVK